MHTKDTECPISNPQNCKEYYNPKICAFSRKDRICLKKKKIKQKNEEQPDILKETGGPQQTTP